MVSVWVESRWVRRSVSRVFVNRFGNREDIADTLDFDHDVFFTLNQIVVDNIEDRIESADGSQFAIDVVKRQIKRIAAGEVSSWNQELKDIVIVAIGEEVIQTANRCATNRLERYKSLFVWNIRQITTDKQLRASWSTSFGLSTLRHNKFDQSIIVVDGGNTGVISNFNLGNSSG